MRDTIKRTYNLTTEAVAHVREMVGRGELPTSQDGIVELAIDRLYRAVSDQDDVDRWARAAQDQVFIVEMRTVSADMAEAEARPTE